jgi:hypothetical protein
MQPASVVGPDDGADDQAAARREAARRMKMMVRCIAYLHVRRLQPSS